MLRVCRQILVILPCLLAFAAAAQELPSEDPFALPAATASAPLSTPPEPAADPASELPPAAAVSEPPVTPAPEAPLLLPANLPEVTVEPPEPFLQALISAYNTNPDLKAEREALKSVDEGVAQAISGFRPEAVATYEQGRARGKTTGVWDYDDEKNRALLVEQPLFRGGQTFYGFQSAKQQVKAARERLRSVEQQVLFDAVNAYSDVYEKQSVLGLNQSNVDVLNRQLEATQARFDVGELTRTDVAQAEARLAQAEAELRRAEGDLKASRATFQRVVGYSADNLLPNSMIPELPASLEEAVSVAEQFNPSINAALHLEKSSAYAVNSQIGGLLPEVVLRGTMSRSEGAGFVRQLDNDALTMHVTVPLYQSGAEYSRIREAKNQRLQSKYERLDTRNAVLEAVTRTFADYQASLSVITSTQAAVNAAEIAKEGVREEQEFGVRTILDVLDAEQESFVTRVNLVRAERSKTLQAYRLMAAIGKLSARELGLPVEVYDAEEHYDTVKWLPIGF